MSILNSFHNTYTQSASYTYYYPSSMASNLSTKVADYNFTLNITPQVELVEAVDRTQATFETDDGLQHVVSATNINKFDVTLSWPVLPIASSEAILDLWANSSKANGRARTFYWEHPSDGNTYVVRFTTPVSMVQTGRIANYRGINSVTLRVEGRKA